MSTITSNNQVLLLDKELSAVLNQDWQDYDEKKITQGIDPKNISCMVGWEVDYIVNKINSTLKHYSIRNCRRAVNIACMATYTPAPRAKFLEQVMGVLYLL